MQTLKLRTSSDTYSLLLIETHDLHGLQGLIKQHVILLAGDLHMPRHQETVGAEAFQQEVL